MGFIKIIAWVMTRAQTNVLGTIKTIRCIFVLRHMLDVQHAAAQFVSKVKNNFKLNAVLFTLKLRQHVTIEAARILLPSSHVAEHAAAIWLRVYELEPT